jgi:hypothetical protein
MKTVKHGKELVRKYAPKYCIKHFARKEISGTATVRSIELLSGEFKIIMTVLLISGKTM